jgi:hypothetical protein
LILRGESLSEDVLRTLDEFKNQLATSETPLEDYGIGATETLVNDLKDRIFPLLKFSRDNPGLAEHTLIRTLVTLGYCTKAC